MAYTKTTWEDLPSTNTPITASNLNNIENQVYANTNDIATNTTNIATNASDISTLNTTISNIISSGSNANGNYVKYSDGTMICWNNKTFASQAITSQFEGIYYANTGAISYPQTFYYVPTIIGQTSIAGGGFTIYGQNTTTTFSGFFWKIQSGTMNVIFNWVAIGRWKA